jgi:hypothetical protein
MAKHSSVRVGFVHTQLEDVLLPIGLVLASVKIEGQDIKMESHPISVAMPHKAHFHASLRTKDLANFLNQKSPAGLKGFNVTSSGGHIYVDAVKTILVDVPVKAVCKLKIHERKQIFVDVVSVDVMGSGATNFLQSQIEKINPVLDADDFPVDAEFDEIEIEEGEVIVKGRMSPRT